MSSFIVAFSRCSHCLSVSLSFLLSLWLTTTSHPDSFHPSVCWEIEIESQGMLRDRNAVIYLPCLKDKEDDGCFSTLHVSHLGFITQSWTNRHMHRDKHQNISVLDVKGNSAQPQQLLITCRDRLSVILGPILDSSATQRSSTWPLRNPFKACANPVLRLPVLLACLSNLWHGCCDAYNGSTAQIAPHRCLFCLWDRKPLVLGMCGHRCDFWKRPNEGVFTVMNTLKIICIENIQKVQSTMRKVLDAQDSWCSSGLHHHTCTRVQAYKGVLHLAKWVWVRSHIYYSCKHWA